MVTIDMLSPDDWQRLKHIRVLSVADSPDAFGTTLDEVRSQSDQYWQELARGFIDERQAMFIAVDAAMLVGSTYTRVGGRGCGHIGSMWVASSHRRRGLGQRLLDTGIDWLRSRGMSVAQLRVTEGNGPATMLYEANGFSLTDEREMLREGGDLKRAQMERRLDT